MLTSSIPLWSMDLNTTAAGFCKLLAYWKAEDRPKKGLNVVSLAFQTPSCVPENTNSWLQGSLSSIPGSPVPAEVRQAAGSSTAPACSPPAPHGQHSEESAAEGKTLPREFHTLTLKGHLTSPGSWQHQCQQQKMSLSFHTPSVQFDAFPQADLPSSLPQLRA